MTENQPNNEPEVFDTSVPVLEGELRAAAEKVFGDRLILAERYVEHLATSGFERGLIGPREVPRLWERHVLNCAVIEEVIAQNARLADVGSGAGLPGLCLALARPDLTIHLIEPLERRCIWLQEVIDDLGLENVTVWRSRSEGVIGRFDVDVVTARAVSALDKLVGLTVPLLQGEGEVVAIKGRSVDAEIAKAAKIMKKFRVQSTEVVLCGEDLLEEPTTVARLKVASNASKANQAK